MISETDFYKVFYYDQILVEYAFHIYPNNSNRMHEKHPIFIQ
jgi:hypothetical protein